MRPANIKIDFDMETGAMTVLDRHGRPCTLEEAFAAEPGAEPSEPLTPERARAMLAEQMAHCPDCAANPEVLAAGYMDADGRMVDTTNQMRALRDQAPLRDDSDPNWWHGKRTRRTRRGRR